MNEKVWEAKLDDLYECSVERTDQYNGTLKIEQGNAVLFEQAVTLSFGAVFGPDVSDLAAWQETCIEFVDGLQK